MSAISELQWVSFHHGLGDCVWFAHLLEYYRRRGVKIGVAGPADRRPVYEAFGIDYQDETRPQHPVVKWLVPQSIPNIPGLDWWRHSKWLMNLSVPPLPDIGGSDGAWKEFVGIDWCEKTRLPERSVAAVRRFMAELPKPIVLVHAKGVSNPKSKTIPEQELLSLYDRLITDMDCSVIQLNRDKRAIRLASWRFRDFASEFGHADVWDLTALISQADLLIGVDSGPLHVARLTRTPALGVWMGDQHPAMNSTPCSRHGHVVFGGQFQDVTRDLEIPFNVRHGPTQVDSGWIAQSAEWMLKPRFLTGQNQARDALIQSFLHRQHGAPRRLADMEPYVLVDRHKSYELLFDEIRRRFTLPTLVETGVIRHPEDYAGAGFSTYVLGAFLAAIGGRLISIDNSEKNCGFARSRCRFMLDHVQIIRSDSVEHLSQGSDPIDVLILDSLDQHQPGHAEHMLREFQAARHRLHDQSIVVLDDTVWAGKQWQGKGSLLVPAMLAEGWSILFSGLQVVLSRDD